MEATEKAEASATLRLRREIVLLNANTTAPLTERMVSAAAGFAGDGLVFRGITAPFGEPYISTPAAAARAAEAVAVVAGAIRAAARPSALIIACFGDPGLWAARDVLSMPVIGMAEASCHCACQTGRRFSIVTGGHAWSPMLTDFVATIGLSTRLASVRTLELTGDRIGANPDAAAEDILTEVKTAATEDGANVVILRGAGLVGMAARLAGRAKVPLLDSLACAVAQAEAMVRVRQAPGA